MDGLPFCVARYTLTVSKGQFQMIVLETQHDDEDLCVKTFVCTYTRGRALKHGDVLTIDDER